MTTMAKATETSKVVLSLPLEVTYYKAKTSRGKDKKFILNLNNYRNAHHRILSLAKVAYSNLIKSLVPEGIQVDRCRLRYIYYPKTRRRYDVSNPCSVIDKFVCDTLTELGVWPDDSSEFVRGVAYIPGEVDKENPRCELEIIPL